MQNENYVREAHEVADLMETHAGHLARHELTSIEDALLLVLDLA